MRLVIVGGVAGGANVATRARRLSESVEIVLLERGEHVSFANCGLPYHIGGEIAERSKLLVQTPKSLADRFRIDVRVRHEVQSINPKQRTIAVRRLDTGEDLALSYDNLVLATGAAPLRPPLPGIDLPGIFVLRDLRDMDGLIDQVSSGARRAAIVGAGFIGLEVAEQLRHRGLDVTVIDSNAHPLVPFDPEMASIITEELTENGIALRMSDPVSRFEKHADGSIVVGTKSGYTTRADLVLLSIGVAPESRLAANAGLAVSSKKAIIVDEFLRTSDPNIWALGDCVQLPHRISGREAYIPLAGPANRAGRQVADNILGDRRPFRGPLGTAIIRVFTKVAACTGYNERALQTLGLPYRTAHLHPGSHAGYYPGARRISLKVLFDPTSGKILGAQAVGEDGVDKRIDVIATAIAGGLTVEDLIDLDLSYAPPFGSAKDPVNHAGMICSNVLKGVLPLVSTNELPGLGNAVWYLDVRDPTEVSRGAIPGATNIPLNELRTRLDELPRDQTVVVYCQSGQRSHTACQILRQNGISCLHLSGGYLTWSASSAAHSEGASTSL